MGEIAVSSVGDDRYSVSVRDERSETVHEVVATSADLERFGGDSGEALVEASFRFLLEREPKESIMRRFDLPVILRFFPEYTDRIGEYLE